MKEKKEYVEKLRKEYCELNGIRWIKPENTRAKDYVKFLESKIFANQPSIVVEEDGVTVMKEPPYETIVDGKSALRVGKYWEDEYNQAERITVEEHNKRLVAHANKLLERGDGLSNLLYEKDAQFKATDVLLQQSNKKIEELKAEIERLNQELKNKSEHDIRIDKLKSATASLKHPYSDELKQAKEQLKAKDEVIEKMKEPVKYAIDSVENDVKESRLPESYTKDVNDWKQLLSGLTKEID